MICDINTCPDLAILITNIAVNWKLPNKISIHKGELFDGVDIVFEVQEEIGWRLFFGWVLGLPMEKCTPTILQLDGK